MAETITILIKGMVCNRCIIAIDEALKMIGVRVKVFHLGIVEVYKTHAFNLDEVHHAITNLGFEILIDKKEQIVQKVKNLVDEVLSSDHYSVIKFSTLISDNTNINYDSISGIFSEKEGVTIEQYIINSKIERVKLLLTQTDLTLTDISFKTNYSSVHHLSKQFKEKQGINPSQYRLQTRQPIIR